MKTQKFTTAIFSTIAIFILAIANASAQGSWSQKANFAGTARREAVGFSIGSKGYIGTGTPDGGITKTKDFWEWNQAVNVWTQKADFAGTARTEAVGFSIGNKGYVGTGNAGANTNDFWEYDPGSNAWGKKADFPGAARSQAVGFNIGNKGYLGTGNVGANTTDFWEYDPATNVWSQKADFGGGARREAIGFSIGSKGYIGTGDAGVGKNDFWEYDPSINSWTQKANFAGGVRISAVGFSINTKGYIGTGYDGALRNDFWEYDASTNIWNQKVNFSGTARNQAVGLSVGTKGYIGTGNDGAVKQDFWEFNPAGTTTTLNVAVSGNATICSGSSANLAATVTGGVVPYTYQWTPAGNLSCSTCNNPTAAPTITTSYSVVVTDNVGAIVAKSLTITVMTCGSLGVSVSSTNVTCYGSNNGSAKATPSVGTMPYKYNWSPAGGTNATATGLSAGSYQVMVTDNNNVTEMKTVIISQPSAIVSSLPLIQICSGTCVTITSAISGGTPAYNYQWSPGGQTDQSINVCPTTTTSYALLVSDANGCMDTVATTVTVNPKISASLALKQDSVNPLLWYTYQYLTGTAPFNYLWNFGDGSTSTQAFPSHVYAAPGHYAVCLTITDAKGCSASTCDSTYRIAAPGIMKFMVAVNPNFSGIKENTISVNSVFPNPANDRIEVSLNQLVTGNLNIVDVMGREVYAEKINTDKVKVDVSALPVGYYNLSIVSGDNIMRAKIMIAR